MTTAGSNMKKHLLTLLTVVAAFASIPAQATVDTSTGDIYSIDLVDDNTPGNDFGGRIPTAESPLGIGEKLTIRVRMLSANYGPMNSGVTWQFIPTEDYLAASDALKVMFTPKLALMFGDRIVYADLMAQPIDPADRDRTGYRAGYFSDLYFQYTVTAGDLALPARLVAENGKVPDPSTPATKYLLLNSNFWKIQASYIDEVSRELVTTTALFTYCDENPVPDPDPSNVHPATRTIDGTALNMHVRTVDFDNEYAQPAEAVGEEGVWRRLYRDMTTTTTILPTLVVDGPSADAGVIMYVWVTNSVIAAPLASDGAYKMYEGTADERFVLPVKVPQGKESVTFRLKGLQNGTVDVFMSSTPDIIYDGSGGRVDHSVRRTVEVVDPPAPFVRITVDGDRSTASVLCQTNYQDYVTTLKVTLSQPSASTVKVDVTPALADLPEGQDVFSGDILGISATLEGAAYANTTRTVTFSPGETEKTLYVFAKGATVKSASDGISFTPTVTEDPEGKFAGFTPSEFACRLLVSEINPVIVKPTNATRFEDIVAAQDYPITFTIADSYKDMRTKTTDPVTGEPTSGFKLHYKLGNSGSVWQDSDFVFPDPVTGELVYEFKYIAAGNYTTEVQVIDPEGRKSEPVKFGVRVSEAMKAWATLDQPDGYYAEGKTALVKFHLSQVSPDGVPVYAFLVPKNEAATNKTASTSRADSNPNLGIQIPVGATNSVGTAEIELKDGGAIAIFDVVVCKSETYDATQSAGYSTQSLYLNITNVVPSVKAVRMGGASVKASGQTMPKDVAQGVTKTFTVDLNDGEVPADLNAEEADAFLTRWSFDGGTPVEVKGDPSKAACTWTPSRSGSIPVTVRFQDKDMRTTGTWSEEFEFFVNVLDAPKITIANLNENYQFSENVTDLNARRFTVSLNVPPEYTNANDKLIVKLDVTCNDTEDGNYKATDLKLSATSLEFRSNSSLATFSITSMDGTQKSAARGFKITASVDTVNSSVDVDKKTWFADSCDVFVINAAPQIYQPVELLDKEGNPQRQSAQVGVPLSIPWSVFDIDADLVPAAGRGDLTVVFTTSEGARKEYTSSTATGRNVSTGTHTVTFGSPGEKTVTIQVTDKDGDTAVRTLYYYIKPSKQLSTYAHGPGNGFASTLGGHYSGARGLGRGRTWVGDSAQVQGVTNWRIDWNCGTRERAYAYAWGYKVGQTDDGTLAGGDQGVTTSGGKLEAGGAAYTYTGEFSNQDGLYDSFFYCWLLVSTGEEGVAAVVYGGYNPEKGSQGGPTASVKLPDTQSEAEDYDETNIEAIFAREWLPSDNCGDINQDGIPDLLVKMYGYEAKSGEEAAAAPETEGKTVITDDLANLANLNDDNDYLPSTTTAGSGLVPGLTNSWIKAANAFTMIQEIRGFGNGLNRLNKKGISGSVGLPDGVTPDQDFTEVEQMAFDEAYAAALVANPALTREAFDWSPERPTDPTTDDTDGDGITDGYEYWMWYRAWVGWIDENGNHQRLEGERFDPTNPVRGTKITWQEIAAAFDPLVPIPADQRALQDTDNDGLPDVLEFALGTNPVHWDTDGDGLPDYWEVTHGVGQFDPLTAVTQKPNRDNVLNPDGDFMASIAGGVPMTVIKVREPNGKIGYYATQMSTDDVCDLILETPDEPMTGWLVTDKATGVKYMITGEVAEGTDWCEGTNAGASGSKFVVLLKTFGEDRVFTVEERDGGYYMGLPTRLAAFTRLAAAPEEQELVTYKVASPLLGRDGKFGEDRCYGCWQYGQAAAGDNYGGFVLSLEKDLPEGAVVVDDPFDADVGILHFMVYQWRTFLKTEFTMGSGFDPRTAWNINASGVIADRWRASAIAPSDPMFPCPAAATIGKPVDTRAYAVYDEFLLMPFLYHVGGADLATSRTRTIANIMDEYTTLPAAATHAEPDPNDPNATAVVTDNSASAADSDGDGVPDGWELYVMAGPGEYWIPEGEEVRANRFKFQKTFSPLVNEEKAGMDTRLGLGAIYDIRQQQQTGQPEELTLRNKFAGTDTLAAYAACATINNPENLYDQRWLNKFLPCDPWSNDTDCDGIPDHLEGTSVTYPRESPAYGKFIVGTFLYGTPVDNGGQFIAGAGMNPCSWDTDRDGLPDPWEAQFYGTWTEAKAADGAADDAAADDDAGAVAKNDSGSFGGGMDATVPDSYNKRGGPNRDYDADGLDNWQEYMTGTLRCFRYDDTTSPWITPEIFDEADPETAFYEALAGVSGGTDVEPLNPFVKGRNPNLVFGKFDHFGAYFSRCGNEWDLSYGQDYMFCDGVNHCQMTLASYWNRAVTDYPTVAGQYYSMDPAAGFVPTWYATTDPRQHDSDGDNMDDYYELFHGLNPLLGARDLVNEQWKGGIRAEANYWTYFYQQPLAEGTPAPRGNDADAKLMDFAVYPWMNGLAGADPDGDDIRNQDESIMPNMESTFSWLHTDPTPLWMTDSTYTNSLTHRYFQTVTAADQYATGDNVPGQISYDGETYVLADGDYAAVPDLLPHRWAVSSGFNFEFEEIEGYDTDRDSTCDRIEASAKTGSGSDPQHSDDPHARQAMYLPGEQSALQVRNDPTFGFTDEHFFIQFTVEAWGKPDADRLASGEKQVLFQRVIENDKANPGDEQHIRRNFEIGLVDGHWYAAYDDNGTSARHAVIATDPSETAAVWTHVAATCDGEYLSLYVNGRLVKRTRSTIRPANTTAFYVFDETLRPQRANAYNNHTFVVGAGVLTSEPFKFSKNKADAATVAWADTEGNANYGDFFKGFVDEIRIWDGARGANDILTDYQRRFSEADLVANRNAVYDEWKYNVRRWKTPDDVYNAYGELPPELCYYYTFDGLFAATEAKYLAKAAYGFNAQLADGGRALTSRPEDFLVGWWTQCGVHSLAYDDYAWMPWVPNLVSRLPRMDGTAGDSKFWSKYFAGHAPASDWGYSSFTYVQTHEPMVDYCALVSSLNPRSHRETLLEQLKSPAQEKLTRFTTRGEGLYCSDLLPLGTAFCKYIDEMWDGGASTTWIQTGVDADNDHLPDWWENTVAGSGRYTDFSGNPLDPATLTWETIVIRDGKQMTAGQAYQRDLMAGAHQTGEPGELTGVLEDPLYAQTADEDQDGLPDWWENFYGISGSNAYDDDDNDGLSNYVEYLLSEVFSLEGPDGKPVTFSPIDPLSADGKTLDYFFAAGLMYVGESFTDHDFMLDSWEYAFGLKNAQPDYFASPLKWDALTDSDEDGWSNFAEARYAANCRAITANLANEYPVPSIHLTVRYEGVRSSAVKAAPIGIKVWSDRNMADTADATFLTAEGGASTGGDNAATEKEYDLGAWGNRHVIGTLTPGYINKDSLQLQGIYTPSASSYSWVINDAWCPGSFRGTWEEYQQARRDHDSVDLVESEAEWRTISGIKFYTTENGTELNMVFNVPGRTESVDVGRIDTRSGSFDLDLGAFKGLRLQNATNALDVVSMEDMSFKLVYTADETAGLTLPREVYLGRANEGHIREGLNQFVVWADLDGDGTFTPGEPYGFLRDVNIGWYGRDLKVRLTETSPVFARLDMTDGLNDRETLYPDDPDVYDTGTDKTAEGYERVRVVRLAIDSIEKGGLMPAYAAVVYDQRMAFIDRKTFTEADILCSLGNEFDLDWNAPARGAQYDLATTISRVKSANPGRGIEGTNVYYTVYFGNGDITVASLTNNNQFSKLILRKFDVTRMNPVPVSPGAKAEGVLYDVAPTFKWHHNGYDTYPAFKIRVTGSGFSWTSDYQLCPAMTDDGDFEWTAPLRVGALVPGGTAEFKNGETYTWSISTYNAKYKTDSWVSGGSFRVNVQTNNIYHGTMEVCVRYYGPAKTDAPIRVQAFASPDFTGEPVSEGYVYDTDSLANRDGLVTANARLIGLPAGQYYVRAFLDTQNDGQRANWESWGYYANRSGSSKNIFEPLAVKVGPEVGGPVPFILYLEDCDTDQDKIPDAYEWNGSNLTKYGVTDLNDKIATAAGYVLKSDLVKKLKAAEEPGGYAGGLATRALASISSAETAALLLGIDLAQYDNGVAALNALTMAGSLTIGEFAIGADGEVTLGVNGTASGAKVSGAGRSLMSATPTAATTVVCEVLRADTPDAPAADWKVVATGRVALDGRIQELKFTPTAEAKAKAGFFRVRVVNN